MVNLQWPNNVKYGEQTLVNVNAYIRATISHGNYWWEIMFEGNAEDTNCHIHFDPLLLEIHDWTQLENVSVKWSSPINPVNEDHWGMTYCYTHSLINKCRIEITNRRGNRFFVRAAGEDEADVKFSIDAPTTFEFVEINSLDPETVDSLTHKLGKYLNTKNLTPGELTIKDDYDDGRVYTCAKFAPIVDDQ